MDFILDALKDSLILVPFLLGAYILIEVIETLTSKKFHSSAFVHPAAPLFGAGFGLLPQCGFSVVATDMFAQKKLTMGTLIAIYIATSDEAIPIIIANPDKVKYLLPMILIKFVYALIIGFGVDLIARIGQKRVGDQAVEKANDEIVQEEHEHSENEEGHIHVGCCKHNIEENVKEPWAKRYLLHPGLHTLKIFAYILVINLIFSTVIHFVGEDAISNFLGSNVVLAPIISVLVGLIPNCASSIIITELFIHGSLSFGATLAGLSVNAGLGLIVLYRQNKSIKTNLTITAILILSGLLLGYAVQLIMRLAGI